MAGSINCDGTGNALVTQARLPQLETPRWVAQIYRGWFQPLSLVTLFRVAWGSKEQGVRAKTGNRNVAQVLIYVEFWIQKFGDVWKWFKSYPMLTYGWRSSTETPNDGGLLGKVEFRRLEFWRLSWLDLVLVFPQFLGHLHILGDTFCRQCTVCCNRIY